MHHTCSSAHRLILSVLLLALSSAALPPQADPVLVAGDPQLTQSMVDHRLAVWNTFFEVSITREQHDILQRAMIDAWKRHDKDWIEGTQSDIKLYGHESDIVANRLANISAYVEGLRKMTNDPGAVELVKIYDAAHPERRDFMRAHGMGELVGVWKRQDAMVPSRDASTGRYIGISFTDTLILHIFADGRFKHFWSHSHCQQSNTCCRQYATDTNGTVSTSGATLTLKADSGTQLFKDACNAATNTSGPMTLQNVSLQWSIRNNAGKSQLCLSTQPFDPWRQGPDKAVCYDRQPE